MDLAKTARISLPPGVPPGGFLYGTPTRSIFFYTFLCVGFSDDRDFLIIMHFLYDCHKLTPVFSAFLLTFIKEYAIITQKERVPYERIRGVPRTENTEYYFVFSAVCGIGSAPLFRTVGNGRPQPTPTG